MQDTLKIAIIQSSLIWEDPNENRSNFAVKINEIEEQVDIILLPEMFTSGFTMNPERVAETMQGASVEWMLDLSKRTNSAIGGSMVISEDGNYYNRFIFAEPDGALEFYDKRHTFTLAGEDKVYQSGSEKRIINYHGWKICPLVCYDLRFPVWARNVEDYDVLIYVANWPKPRISAWDALLKARSIENMCYCIGVNRVGLDATKYEYPGHSATYNGLGEKITNFEDDKEQTKVVTLSKSHIQSIRRKLKFLEDRDSFNLSK